MLQIFKKIISLMQLSTVPTSFTVYLFKNLKLTQNRFLNLKTEFPIP